MPSKLVKLTTLNNIAPGEKRTRKWNNATPSNAVWYIQAVPLASSLTASATEQSLTVEVPRVWRRLIVKKELQGEFEVTEIEHEVHYEVKNIGDKEVDVDVYASIIS